MAIGRLSVGVGRKGTASPHAEYIAREGKYAKDEKVEKLEATGQGNMPEWAQANPNFFWKMSDEHERKNGTSYREHVISLPRELTPDQRHELIKNWIKQEIGDKHSYQYAIHNPPAMDGRDQPHAHIMFSERLIDDVQRDPDQFFKRYNSKHPEKGGAKKANTPKLAAERKNELKQQRDRWEKLCNSHLELAGKKVRISMKSLKDRGFKRKPVNFTMIQIQKPAIKSIYLDDLKAKRAWEVSMRERRKIDIPIELGRQTRLADIAKMREAAQQQAAEKATQAKLAQQAAEKATQAKLAQQAAEKATQAKLAQQAAEKATQAKLAQQAAEKATQAKLAQQAAEKAAQLIEQRKPSEMLNKLGLRVRVVDLNRRGEISVTYSDNVTLISVNLHKLIKNGIAKDKQILISNTDGFNVQVNPEYAKNNTARAFEKFMLQKNVLSDPQILIDFGLGKESLGIREFAVKYNIKYDLDDLQKLNDMNPPKQFIEPMQDTGVNAALNAEQKPRVDSSYDNSPDF